MRLNGWLSSRRERSWSQGRAPLGSLGSVTCTSGNVWAGLRFNTYGCQSSREAMEGWQLHPAALLAGRTQSRVNTNMFGPRPRCIQETVVLSLRAGALAGMILIAAAAATRA